MQFHAVNRIYSKIEYKNEPSGYLIPTVGGFIVLGLKEKKLTRSPGTGFETPELVCEAADMDLWAVF